MQLKSHLTCPPYTCSELRFSCIPRHHVNKGLHTKISHRISGPQFFDKAVGRRIGRHCTRSEWFGSKAGCRGHGQKQHKYRQGRLAAKRRAETPEVEEQNLKLVGKPAYKDNGVGEPGRWNESLIAGEKHGIICLCSLNHAKLPEVISAKDHWSDPLLNLDAEEMNNLWASVHQAA